MPASIAAIPSNASFLGVGKEVTRGTAVVPSDYIVVREFTAPADKPNYTPDAGLRGSAVKTYNQVATQTWAEPTYSGDVFPDTVGYWLHALLGEVATTGAGVPFQHVFTVLNTSPFQPPSYTLTDSVGGSGTDTFSIPGCLVKELTFEFSATGLLSYSVSLAGFKSVPVAKPTPSFSVEVVKPAWQGAVLLGPGGTVALAEGSLSIKRTVDPIPTVNGSQDPAAIWGGGDVEVTGKLMLVALAGNAEYSKFVGNVHTSLDVNFASGAGAAERQVKLHCSDVIYTAVTHGRGKSYVELDSSFEAVANTTDKGVSGGFGPAVVTLKSARSSY